MDLGELHNTLFGDNEEPKELTVKVKLTTDEFQFIKDVLIDIYEKKVGDDTFCGIGYRRMVRDCLISFDGKMEAIEIEKDYLYEKNKEK